MSCAAWLTRILPRHSHPRPIAPSTHPTHRYPSKVLIIIGPTDSISFTAEKCFWNSSNSNKRPFSSPYFSPSPITIHLGISFIMSATNFPFPPPTVSFSLKFNGQGGSRADASSIHPSINFVHSNQIKQSPWGFREI